ncbi:MAG: hypothetical protein ACR2GH_14950 [Pseudonocardia sp.]
MATEPPSIHPTQQLHTPAGEPVAIDLDMVPLIQALWALDLTTLGCCQDNGEYARVRREMCPEREPTGHSGFIDYHLGWAWVKMPVADTTRLTETLLATSFRDAITVRWQRGSWRLDIPFIYDPNSGMGPAPAVQIHFPREHIPELTSTLSDLSPGVKISVPHEK